MLLVEADWRPILLGAVFKAAGRGSWAETDRREDGMREVERRAHAYGLPPLRWPERWPGDGLTAMRAATFAAREGFGMELALAGFRLAFTKGRDLSLRENVLAAAAACGAERAVERAVERQDVKDALRAATDAAIARGVIGVPTLAVGDDLFWGDDRLEEAAARVRAG